jgi:transposase-like protein
MARRKSTTPPAAPAAPKADTGGQAAPSVPEGETDGLTVAEARFVTLSASGEPMDGMAATLGVCSRTLRRWKRRPEVASAIAELTRESMAVAKSTLAHAANKAARELVDLSESATPDASRVSAARAILEHAEKFVELAELSDRLTELETKLGRK